MDRDQDIKTLTTTFYYLNDLYDRAADMKINLGSRMIVDQYNNRFARLLYDYCLAICLGEARHAQRICDKRIDELVQFNLDRHDVYNNANYFSEHSIISSCIEVFSCNWGYRSFGGNAWKVITETVGRYGTISNRLWIDFIIDLEHNSGCIFNKPLYFSYVGHDSYKRLLDYKRNMDIWNDENQTPMAIYKQYETIFQDAVELGIITKIPEWIYFVDPKQFPKPVEYGYINLTVVDNRIQERRQTSYCHRCDDDYKAKYFCYDCDHCKRCCTCNDKERRRERPRERRETRRREYVTCDKCRKLVQVEHRINYRRQVLCAACYVREKFKNIKDTRTIKGNSINCYNCKNNSNKDAAATNEWKLTNPVCYNCFNYGKHEPINPVEILTATAERQA